MFEKCCTLVCLFIILQGLLKWFILVDQKNYILKYKFTTSQYMCSSENIVGPLLIFSVLFPPWNICFYKDHLAPLNPLSVRLPGRQNHLCLHFGPEEPFCCNQRLQPSAGVSIQYLKNLVKRWTRTGTRNWIIFIMTIKYHPFI